MHLTIRFAHKHNPLYLAQNINVHKEVLFMPNLNDNKFRKIQSESQKQGKTQEEYAAELEMNKLKSQKRK